MKTEEVLEILQKDISDNLLKVYPTVNFYLGRTDDFNNQKVNNENNPKEHLMYTLELAQGNGSEICKLKELLFCKLSKNYKNLLLGKENDFYDANQILYIAFTVDVENDELYELDEKYFLGKNYPINL